MKVSEEFKVTRKKISRGVPGIKTTVQTIWDISEKYSMDFSMIRLARNITKPAKRKDHLGEASLLFKFVKKNVKFVNDPTSTELIQTPQRTLIEGYGDCDDMVTLFVTLNMAIGHGVRMVTISQKPDTYDHIYTEVWIPKLKKWVAFDPSVTNSTPGWAPAKWVRKGYWMEGKLIKEDKLGNFSTESKYNSFNLF